MEPSSLRLTFKTQRDPTMFFPSGGGTGSHVSFFIKDDYSDFMASFYWSECLPFNTS